MACPVALPAQAGETWEPASTTATSITGSVVFSSDQIVFESGDSLSLARIGPSARIAEALGTGSATLYHVLDPDDPVLVGGNRICGSGNRPNPVTYIAVWSGSGAADLPDRGFAAFNGDAAPTGTEDLCGTFTYALAGRR